MIIVDDKNMQTYFRQTREFIFLDRVQIQPGIKAWGEKMVSGQDWYFRYHFPQNPVMPGVFQMEALMQTGGLIINVLPGKAELRLFFSEAKKIKVNGSVAPGDVLQTEVTMKSYKRGVAWFDGVAKVKDKITCQMEFSLLAPDEVAEIMGKRG